MGESVVSLSDTVAPTKNNQPQPEQSATSSVPLVRLNPEDQLSAPTESGSTPPSARMPAARSPHHQLQMANGKAAAETPRTVKSARWFVDPASTPVVTPNVPKASGTLRDASRKNQNQFQSATDQRSPPSPHVVTSTANTSPLEELAHSSAHTATPQLVPSQNVDPEASGSLPRAELNATASALHSKESKLTPHQLASSLASPVLTEWTSLSMFLVP